MIWPFKHLSRRKNKLIIWTVVLVVIGGSIFYLLRSLNSPAEGTVYQTTAQASEPLELKDFKGQYFTTKYPGRYSLQKNQNPSASLESWILIAHQVLGEGPGSKIAVTVASLPSGGAKESSPYKLFESQPETYTIGIPNFSNEPVIIATRVNAGYEQTALWAHGKNMAIISLTSGQKTDQLEEELETILNNLVWNL